jgi:hypothetical protein
VIPTSLRFLILALISIVCMSGCGGTGSSTNVSNSGASGGSAPTIVTLNFYQGTPTVVAAKIGSGSFTAQTVSSGKLTLSIPSGTTNFVVAYLCTTYEDIFEASTADGTTFTVPCPAPLPSSPTGTLTGNVDINAVPGANEANIVLNNGILGFTQGLNPDTNFSLNVPAGNDRVEIVAFNGTAQGLTALAARSFSNQTVPGALNGGAQVVLGASDLTSNPQPITNSNVPAGYTTPFATADFILAGGGGFAVATGATQYPVLPAGAAENGDFYEIFSSARNAAKPTEMMICAKSSTTAGPVSFTFPTAWSYAGPTPAILPTFDFSYPGFTVKTGVFATATMDWNNPLVGNLEIVVVASANYLNGSSRVAIPDLSGLTGFVSPPSSGTTVGWVALMAQSSVGAPQPMPTNATITTVANSGSYLVP